MIIKENILYCSEDKKSLEVLLTDVDLHGFTQAHN